MQQKIIWLRHNLSLSPRDNSSGLIFLLTFPLLIDVNCMLKSQMYTFWEKNSTHFIKLYVQKNRKCHWIEAASAVFIRLSFLFRLSYKRVGRKPHFRREQIDLLEFNVSVHWSSDSHIFAWTCRMNCASEKLAFQIRIFWLQSANFLEGEILTDPNILAAQSGSKQIRRTLEIIRRNLVNCTSKKLKKSWNTTETYRNKLANEQGLIKPTRSWSCLE